MVETKLPEVGNRYRRKFDTQRTYVLTEIITGGNSPTGCEEFVLRDESDLNYRALEHGYNFNDLNFWNHFEELPDQPTQTTEKPMGIEVRKRYRELRSQFDDAVLSAEELLDQPTEEKQMKEFGEWQLIESAPRKGNILVCDKTGKMAVVFWTQYIETGWVQFADMSNWIHYGGYKMELFKEPTHWMPLPKPPTTIKN